MLGRGLPHFAVGKVVTGFQRGSKELGIPTANFTPEVVDSLPKEVDTGIYCGWANVNDGPVYKMVMSVGWNPFYKNEKKSMVMETHVMHNFSQDFYGSELKVCMLKYLRPERDFKSVEELKDAINNDIVQTSKVLEQTEFLKYKDDDFFKTTQCNGLSH